MVSIVMGRYYFMDDTLKMLTLGNAELFPELMADLISVRSNSFSSSPHPPPHTPINAPTQPIELNLIISFVSIRMPNFFLAHHYKAIVITMNY